MFNQDKGGGFAELISGVFQIGGRGGIERLRVGQSTRR